MRKVLMQGLLILFITAAVAERAWGWHDKTHLAIAKAAGYKHWYNAAGADMAKTKAGKIEQLNHYYNNLQNEEVTAKGVLEQAGKYNDPNDEEGHLYGAIIAALREFKSTTVEGKYAEYHMAFAAHYLGDLSQPLHNVAYDDFNKAHHFKNDDAVEENVSDSIGRIQKRMVDIHLRPHHFEEDLAKEIAKAANLSRILALKLKSENRDMTEAEAYLQLSRSASLLKAVLKNFPAEGN